MSVSSILGFRIFFAEFYIPLIDPVCDCAQNLKRKPPFRQGTAETGDRYEDQCEVETPLDADPVHLEKLAACRYEPFYDGFKFMFDKFKKHVNPPYVVVELVERGKSSFLGYSPPYIGRLG